MTARFSAQRDVLGYYTTRNGRWKAKEHPSGEITLADTTRRARFGPEGTPWTRVENWHTVTTIVNAVEEA